MLLNQACFYFSDRVTQDDDPIACDTIEVEESFRQALMFSADPFHELFHDEAKQEVFYLRVSTLKEVELLEKCNHASIQLGQHSTNQLGTDRLKL